LGRPIVYLIALLGTWLLANESARPWAVLLLVASAVLAVVLWGRQNWISAFPRCYCSDARKPQPLVLLVWSYHRDAACACADLRYAAAPTETFGLAGILWIAGIALLLCSAFFGSHSLWGVSSAPRLPRWPTWEIALLAVLFVLALLSRVWNLTNFPDNIYPDEIMTGTVATQSYLSPTTPPSVFSTLWSGIDLARSLVLVRGRISEAGRDLACNVKAACRFVRGGYGCPALCIVTRNMGQIRGDSWKHNHGFQRFECSLQPLGA
jgi:hypothetical protein